MRYQVLGVNDDKDFCQCCGKEGLKRVVWIEDTETGEIRHFGTTCAASPRKGFGVDKQIKDAIAEFTNKTSAAAYLAHRAYRASGGAYVSNGQSSFKAADADKWTALYKQFLAA